MGRRERGVQSNRLQWAAAIPLHVAVTVPPIGMAIGLTLRVSTDRQR